MSTYDSFIGIASHDNKPPWLEPDSFGIKPDISTYGYMSGKNPVPCLDFQQLRSYVAWDKSRVIKQVWTPASQYLITPEEIPDLFGDVYHREQLYRKQAFRTALLTEAVWLLWCFFYLLRDVATGIFFILALVGIPLLQRTWNLKRSRFYAPKEAREDGERVRFSTWAFSRSAPVTICFVIAISSIWFAQFVSLFAHLGQHGWTPLGAVGLVKSSVWDNGEWWRLFTATVMHSAIWHIMFNMIALWALGKLVEVLAGWHWMALTFLFSAFTGSLFSLVLLPATSIGSSGGIMGLLGFLLVLGYFRRGLVPVGLLKALLSGVGLIFLIGFVGFLIIDNAAHLGGLLGGGLLGLLAARISVPESSSIVPFQGNLALRSLGGLAVFGVALTILTTIFLLFAPAS